MPFGSKASQARRAALAAIAHETVAQTPTVSAALPHLSPTKSTPYSLSTLAPLDPSKSPKFSKTSIRVVPSDSFEAAISMPSTVLGDSENSNDSKSTRVAVLNMASEKNPGGGFLRGASAQEEALCFRSTLAASLHKNLYPIAPRDGVYTRDVIVFRTSAADGHELMPFDEPEKLPVVSVLSVAGIRKPETKKEGGRVLYKEEGDRELTRDKMRLCLRMAAAEGHTLLVLGALGCGAFRNPVGEVANCWGEVLGEEEFKGWFREVWFAVYDRRGEGNLEVFKEVLEGANDGGD
ncbi:hypothetical protein OQA88_13163 [Cercophora sp. LCS_1]